MRIGYSFWGFLGNGVIDTPDGGRSHRRTLIDGLRAAGHDLVFLQANRDLREADTDLRAHYRWDETGLPAVDTVMLEWRWPITGRNTTPCGAPGHTCDLHRQAEILDHYTRRGVPTLLWDKDQQLATDDPLRVQSAVTVCEPALHPSPGARSLLFPLADTVLDTLDPYALAAGPRDVPLLYIGNQYDRDATFDTYFAPAARTTRHIVAGKWTRTDRWPHINFIGRVGFGDVRRYYRRALATVLLLPDRYARSGQMTQRLFEAITGGCLPLAPSTITSIDRYVPPALHITDADHAITTIKRLQRAPRAERADLLTQCLARLDLFRLSRQLDVIQRVLLQPTPTAVTP